MTVYLESQTETSRVRLLLLCLAFAASLSATRAVLGEAREPRGRSTLVQDPASDPNFPVWTLEHCIDAALETSPEMVQQRLEVAIAEAQRQEARAARAPQVKFETQGAFLKPLIGALWLVPGSSTSIYVSGIGPITIPSVSTGLPTGFGQTSYIPPSTIKFEGFPDRLFQTTASLNQPLYTSGKISAGIRLAWLNRALESHQLAEQGIETSYLVNQLYMGLLMGESTLALLKTMREEMVRIVEDTQAIETQGLVSRADVLEAISNLRRMEEEQANAEMELIRGREYLRLMVGAPDDDPMQVTGELADLLPQSVAGLPELLETALQERPELETRQTQVALAEANVALRKADLPFRPTLGLSLEGGVRGSRIPVVQTNWTMYWDYTYTIGAALQLNLFDGGAAGSRVRQAQLRQEQATRGEAQTRALIRVEVQEAQARLVAAERGMARAEAREDEQDEKHRVAKLGVETGILGRTEYLGAYLEWAQARAERLVATFTLQQARLDLSRAIGRLPTVTKQGLE